jgi:protein-disulfide isomerase
MCQSITRLPDYSITRLIFLALATIAASPAAAGQPQAPPLVVSSVTPDPGGQVLTIEGASFGGGRPFVTLDLVPVNVRYASEVQIVAAVPVGQMPPGTYLLTVSRGPSATENGSFQLTLGAAGPKPVEATHSGGAPAALAPAVTEPAAKVGDRVITVAEVDRQWQRDDPGGFAGLSRELYERRRRVIDRMVTDELLAREAAARGLTTQALLDEEVPRRVVTMPESAVLALYQSLGSRTRGASLEQMRPALRAWLTRITQPELAKMTYVEELMKVSTRAEVFLPRPRVGVEPASQDVVLGPATAAVTIVAFGDFQSLEYARFAEAFGKVRETFGDKVRFVYKPLPLAGPQSVDAAVAAACANAQGRFWAFHDAVVAQPGRLGSDRLQQIAGEVGLDRGKYDACLVSGTFSEPMRQALQDGERYAVSASPAFLVNGWLAPPPPPFLPPFEFLKRIIEEELLQSARAGPKN